MRVASYTPAYKNQIDAEVALQMLRDQRTCDRNGIEFDWWHSPGCDLLEMRNQALDKAVCEGWDYLLMCDADNWTTLKTGPVLPMLETACGTGAAVVAALVPAWLDQPRLNAYPLHRGQIYEAEYFGSALMLIDVGQIRQWYSGHDGPCFARKYETPKNLRQIRGSDLFFCDLVREHGQSLWVDGRIPTSHQRLEYEGAM